MNSGRRAFTNFSTAWRFSDPASPDMFAGLCPSSAQIQSTATIAAARRPLPAGAACVPWLKAVCHMPSDHCHDVILPFSGCRQKALSCDSRSPRFALAVNPEPGRTFWECNERHDLTTLVDFEDISSWMRCGIPCENVNAPFCICRTTGKRMPEQRAAPYFRLW